MNPERPGRFSMRAERLLVRVLLCLRRESRASADPDRDARRAEALADEILADFPRRVIPFGVAALAVIAVACAMPLMRDLAVKHGVSSEAVCATAVVETGLRGRTAEVSDGFEALRAVVAPFTPELVGEETPDERTALPEEAAAPYKRS